MSHVSSAREGMPVTFEQWAHLPEDDNAELVDGALVEGELPSCVHEVVVAFFIEILRRWAKERGALVLPSGIKLKVTPQRGRMADVLVYFKGARRPAPRGLVTAPPSIAVEVVSESPKDERRDRVEKLAEYAAFGVRWYWLVDPQVRSFEVFELGSDGRYVHALGGTELLVRDVPGAAGLEVDLPALWVEVDALLEGERDTES